MGDHALSFSSSALLLVYQVSHETFQPPPEAGVAEALQSSERFMSKLGAVHGCSGGALVGALLLCPGALPKVKDYFASGRALRGIGLKEFWDPALLIPRAVEARIDPFAELLVGHLAEGLQHFAGK